jgi:hypothetical protein
MTGSAQTPAASGADKPDQWAPADDDPRSPARSRLGLVRRLTAIRWADVRWIVLGGAGVLAFVFGCIGYTEYYRQLVELHLEDAFRPTDVIYRSLMLFLPDTVPERPDLPIWLDIARFLAPIVAAYAALAGLASLFWDRVQQIKIPFMRNHVVVCGLGYVGGVFIRNLRESKVKVVVIELDPTNPLIEVCRILGTPVIVGDARLERTLHTAGVKRAANLLAVCAEDAVNAEVVAVARRLATSRPRGELHCLARIKDPDLCALLRVQELNLPAEPSSSLDFFNNDEVGARLWLQRFPFDAQGGHPHILVSRLDGLGRWLVRHAARVWYDRRTEDVPLWVSVVDDQAKERVRALIDQNPALERMCQFVCVSTSDREVRQLAKLHAQAAAPRLSRSYVTAFRDEDALEAALALRHALDPRIPLVVAMSRAYGVGRLINDAHASGNLASINIEMFPMLELTCTTEFARSGSFEPIAIALHNQWRDEQLTAQRDAPAWDELDESRRGSNRAQARDIAAKVHSIGCAIVPLRDWDAEDFVFEPAEIERLARDEHDRWIAERVAMGWRLGPRKPEKKSTPYLIPFDELPKETADLDRNAVLAIPKVLAAAGFQVERPPQPALGQSF